MNKIDWSKAPEGATHWIPEGKGRFPGWMRFHEGKWYGWPLDINCKQKWYSGIAPADGCYVVRPLGRVDEICPIRTPEQIEEDEQEKAIDEMVQLFHVPEDGTARQVYGFCSTLYLAGYRKQVAP